VQRKCFAPKSFFFVAVDVYSQLLREFFSVKSKFFVSEPSEDSIIQIRSLQGQIVVKK